MKNLTREEAIIEVTNAGIRTALTLGIRGNLGTKTITKVTNFLTSERLFERIAKKIELSYEEEEEIDIIKAQENATIEAMLEVERYIQK